jgi:hypothetical protein
MATGKNVEIQMGVPASMLRNLSQFDHQRSRSGMLLLVETPDYGRGF